MTVEHSTDGYEGAEPDGLGEAHDGRQQQQDVSSQSEEYIQRSDNPDKPLAAQKIENP